MPQKFIGVTLPIRMGQTGMFDQSTTVLEQVRSNFKNLILTKKGERVGQPELGCDLWKILFEQLTDETLEKARLAVVDAIDRWIPFIELTDFQIQKTDNQNIINIKCIYRFRSNRNVTDQINILTTQLGLPTVAFPVEPTQTEIERVNNQVKNARRIRRIN